MMADFLYGAFLVMFCWVMFGFLTLMGAALFALAADIWREARK